MKSLTLEKLRELSAATWFRCVGQRDTSEAVVLSSWAAALAECGSTDWDDLTLEAANQYRERLVVISRDRYLQWNERMRSIKPVVMPLVERKIKLIQAELRPPKVFADTVRWDLMHFAMEMENADICPPGFFTEQARWYLLGHYPCGRENNDLAGRPIVF